MIALVMVSILQEDGGAIKVASARIFISFPRLHMIHLARFHQGRAARKMRSVVNCSLLTYQLKWRQDKSIPERHAAQAQLQQSSKLTLGMVPQRQATKSQLQHNSRSVYAVLNCLRVL